MRFLGFFIIRWSRLQQLHARNRQLIAELDAARATISELTTAKGPADSRAQQKEQA